MSDYLYLPPNRNVLLGRTVTSTAGTPDAEHHLAWLTDQRPAFPIRYPAGAWGVSVSVDTEDVQLVVLANSSIDASVTVGGAAGTIAAGALGENDVRLNPYLFLSSPAAAVTALTLAGTNTADMVLGECLAGVPLTLKPFQMEDFTDEMRDSVLEDTLDGEYLNIPRYDQRMEWRVFGGTQVYTTAEKDAILAWRRAQRSQRFPSAMILDRTVNDARVVLIGRPSFKQKESKYYWEGRLTFVEFPRYRWS